MAASEPDRELFTGSSDSTARSWNVETGQAIRVFEGHQSPVTCIQVGRWSLVYILCQLHQAWGTFETLVW